jgi:predicted transposase YbfD/YdcC
MATHCQEVAVRMFDPLLALLSEIPDPRRAEGKLYQLPYVLLFSILAVVTGGNSYRAIRTFIAVNRNRLNAAFGLCWKRAPAHTAIRTILHSLDPKAVEQAFRRHAIGLLDGAIDLSQRLVALDGKTLRRSFDHVRDRKAVQLLHAFEAQAGLILAHVDVDEKSNEIPAAQHLLDELPLAHGTITLDALHCQKKTFEAAAQAQAHALVQLKGNQPTLVQQVDIACASQPPASTDISHNTARHRYETRTVEVFGATQAVTDTEWKPLIETIVRVSRKVWHRHAKTGLLSATSETAYYLANFTVSASQAGAAIRSHWHVENKLHYTRDVTFLEDQSRIRRNPGVFARIRSFGYNILRRNQTSTFNQDRYAAALAGLDALLKWKLS